MAIYNFYDTSALLNLDINILDKEETVLSSFVLQELEEIKVNKNRDEKIQSKARAVARKIASSSFEIVNISRWGYRRFLRKNKWLIDCNDTAILATAWYYSNKNSNVTFYTSDYNQFNNAKAIGLDTQFVNDKKIAQLNSQQEGEYTGWSKHYPKEEQMAMLYSDPKMNILQVKANEYCEIFENNELKDILKWNGEEYCRLNYREFKTAIGEKIKPLNLEQKMLFDSLQDRTTPVKLCTGGFGSGKTLIMLAHALELVRKGTFDKICYIRNAVDVKDAAAIGFRPGTMEEKLREYLMPIADHVGGEMEMDELIETNVIEPVYIGSIRGRDYKNTILLNDECENLTKSMVQLIIGRCGKGSEVWFAGDTRQVDKHTFEVDSGIRALIKALAGNKMFSMVKLQKSERSAVARLSDELDKI